MTTPRIGEGQLGRPTAEPPNEQRSTRVGAALASPLAILVVIPGLVALVGIFLTLAGDSALRGSNLEVARDRLSEQTRLVAASLRHALDQSEPVLDRLSSRVRVHDPKQPNAPFAHALADLIQGRPGMAYVSASFADGSFQAAYLDDDGVVRFQESQLAADGTTIDRRYDFGPRDTLLLRRQERTSYDPRQRAFYRLAVERGARTWTKPYPFFRTHYTGVTRAEPVFLQSDGQKRLHAVITVDFDVNAMSSYLRNRQLPSMRALLYAKDGTLLAYPQESAAAMTRLRLREDRTLHYDDLSDPVLKAFFAAQAQASASPGAEIEVQTGGERYLAAVAPASNDPELAWYVAYLAPESYFLRGLHQYERRSFVIGAIAVATAMLVGWLFARHVVKVRREAAQARAEAQEARRAARELGSYRLVTCLGKGGMGEVWKAEHRLLAREAAIKLINPDAGISSEEMRERFRREAETLASLRSRNTIELFDYGVSEDGTFYYVMELLDGMDFEFLVSAYGPQPAARVIQFIIQACSSLAEAHDAGLVHRDIKPANLYICRAADEVDLVKVLDFGLVRTGSCPSKALALETSEHGVLSLSGDGNLTQAGGLLGTPAYMAPEQALGRAIDHRADLYALGCVAFWLLTGRLPFDGPNPMLMMLAHVQEKIPALRPLVSGHLPDELVQIIESCLQKSPEQRPISARALGNALRVIQIPPELAWNDEAAHAWWDKYRPDKPRFRAGLERSRELKIGDERASHVTASGALRAQSVENS